MLGVLKCSKKLICLFNLIKVPVAVTLIKNINALLDVVVSYITTYRVRPNALIKKINKNFTFQFVVVVKSGGGGLKGLKCQITFNKF